MSRDATGIYSAWATQVSTCPVCRMGPGWPCNLDVPGDRENGTHLERTEEAPPWPPPAPERAEAWELVRLALGREPGELDDFADLEKVDAVAARLKVFAARAVEAADAPLRAMLEAKGLAERRIRDAFQATYGAFWKCAAKGCGGYIGPRPEHETEPRGYVCPYCGSTDNMAHGYAPPPHRIHREDCDMDEDCNCPAGDP